jgi:hypothetical protein
MLYIIITIIIILILYQTCNVRESFTEVKSKVILLTQFYEPKWIYRKKEIFECLEQNLNNRHIDEVHLFVEDEFNFEKIFPNNKNLNKIKRVNQKERLSFRDAFEYSNKNLPKNNIKILSNSDIYFNDTLKNIHENLLGESHVLALSRHNLDKKNKLKIEKLHAVSQDSWAWKGNMELLKDDKHYNNDGIKLGYWGCDNYIAALFKKSGYSVSNPCKSIICTHLHKDKNMRVTNSSNRYVGDYLSVTCV